ncbi:hypothetical protein SmJEL517_g06280, partial [Synchytrium microbalum]
DRLTHVQLLFTWNLSPLQSSKFSFEYLLLPPRSVLEAVRPRLTGFRLPWPPSCCLDEPTPFMVSDERAFWHFNSTKTVLRFCYPEGNFSRNQLLDGSISLSPLYPNLTIDLHTCFVVRLLGPCFKTGRSIPFRQHPISRPQSSPWYQTSLH